MTPNFMVFVFARAVILILPEARRWGSVGRGAAPDWGSGSGLGRGRCDAKPESWVYFWCRDKTFVRFGLRGWRKVLGRKPADRPTARTPAAAKGTPLWAMGGKSSKTAGPRGLGGICISPIR